MVVHFLSGDLFGIEGRRVEIEVDLIGSLAQFVVSGRAGQGVREGKERIRPAIQNSGYDYPLTARVVVNLAPATWEKDGAAFDLPIALGILIKHRQIEVPETRGWGVIGELSLDGSIRAVSGVLGMVLALRAAGAKRVIVPAANLAEAQLVGDRPRIHGARDLVEAGMILRGESVGAPLPEVRHEPAPPLPDFADVIGHDRLKHALAVAVAGGHNILLIGPPGTGKSFLARRLVGLLPPLTPDESMEVTRIVSAAGHRVDAATIGTRPFRAPHHTISWAGLVGGSAIPRPGEITLAHHGILFLDEFAEYPRRALEALREPLEEGNVTVSRARGSCTFPARFTLVAAMNPCPCGHYRNPRRSCHCTAEQVRRYLAKISGPLLDRLDLRLEVRPPASSDLLRGGGGSDARRTTAELRELVERAAAHRERHGRAGSNRSLEWKERDRWAPLTPAALELLAHTADERDLSTRALTRVLRMTRTIGDVQGEEELREAHVLEALEYHTPGGGAGFYTWLGGA